jgi:hypothetical protein
MTSFAINIDLTDGAAYRVALCTMDWDNVVSSPLAQRSERIDVLDSVTGNVLATDTLLSFKGEYISFNIKGNVIIWLNNLMPAGRSSKAVVSGLFFGAGTASTSTRAEKGSFTVLVVLCAV